MKRFALLVLVGGVLVASASGASALTIVLNTTAATAPGSAAGDAFRAAADRLEARFSDPVTVRVDIDFATLGPGILGSTGNSTMDLTYGSTRTALLGDVSSVADGTSSAALSAGAALSFWTNAPAVGAPTIVFDADGSANNTHLDVPRANAKALGLLVDDGSTVDGSITFSDLFTWDFDPTDGITAGAFDFTGVAEHELGHLLGFVSGIDIVDVTSGSGPAAPVDLNIYRVFSVLDLFRATPGLTPAGGPITSIPGGMYDYTTGLFGPQWFTVDGGTSLLDLFETGSFNGTGHQASHWRDSLGIGIMDPTAAPGELLAFSAADLLAFDVIGWDITAIEEPNVPEPTTMALFGLGALGLAVGVRRRRRLAA